MSGFKTKKLTPSLPEKSQVTPEKSTIKKSRFVVFRWIIGIAIIFSGIAFAVTFALNLGKDNTKNGSENFTPIIQGNFLSIKKEWTTNILIAGIGGQGHEWSDLTDSIMLASLNGDEKKITLLSIPRDLYVAYPEWKWAGRINSLYGLGKTDGVGVKYLADKVAEITGQQIDHYAVIDFTGFRKIIDVLWGIDIEVPEDLIDTEYPNNNWGYETLIIRKWLQTMDGEKALKYARSRHSTSDFDRSSRQQLIIKSLKEKLFQGETITSPNTLAEVFSTVLDHLDSDMSVARMAELAFSHRSASSENIRIYSLNNECLSLKQCRTWAYLYTPSRDLFGWASVIIPENARANKLSYYDDIRRFSDVLFRFPWVTESTDEIVIVTTKANQKKANSIALSLSKLGLNISSRNPIITATGSITQSHVNIYWHDDLKIGIDPESISVQVLKYLEESLPYLTVTHNEYITDDGPKIEIVLGDDMENYFPFVTPIYYIPAPPPSTTPSGEVQTSISGEKRSSPRTELPKRQNISPEISTPATPAESWTIQPGEWENFGD
jgi:LCP family protein required for cell wall assembly